MPSPASSSRVTVGPAPGGLGLFAAMPVAAGSTVFAIDGVLQPAPDRYSVQVDVASHLHPFPEQLARGEAADLPWWFLNHSCRPTVRIEGLGVIAIRDLAAGEQLTFDYDATEWSLDAPFRCGCGQCGGRLVRGYAHLDAEGRAIRADRAAAHLLRLAGHGHA